MTQKELENKICRKTYYSQTAVNSILKCLFDEIGWALARDEKVRVADFGTFEPKRRNARVGRNPHTKEAIPIPARIIVNFKPTKSLNSKVCSSINKWGVIYENRYYFKTGRNMGLFFRE